LLVDVILVVVFLGWLAGDSHRWGLGMFAYSDFVVFQLIPWLLVDVIFVILGALVALYIAGWVVLFVAYPAGQVSARAVEKTFGSASPTSASDQYRLFTEVS
jgi:hypothetical protein